MSDEMLGKYVDRSEFESDTDFLRSKLKGVADDFAKIKDIKINLGGASGLKESVAGVEALSVANIKLKEELKSVQTLIAQRFATDAKLITIETDYAKATAAGRLELQKKNAELKRTVEYQVAETGSIEKARAAIKALTAERNKLNLYTEEGRARQVKLNEELDKYNNFIKKNVSLLEQQKINIGNYAGSLALPFENLQRTLEKLRNNNAAGIGIGGRTDPASQTAGRQLEQQLNKVFVNASREGATATQQVKQLEVAFQRLSLSADPADKEMKKFLNGLKKQIGEAKDSVQDLKDEIKLNASDTKGIDNVVGSLNVLAGIAQGAAGAFALFGASEEDAAKVTAKLIAVQGIANSVHQVGQELTKKGTIANRIYESSLNTMSTAFGTGSTAAQRFNATLKVGLVGLVITGLVVLIGKIIQWREEQDRLAISTRDLEEIRTEGLKKSSDEIAKVRVLYQVTQDQTLALKDRKKAVDALQKQYPEYFKNLTDEAILAGKAADAYKRLTEKILQTGIAEAAKEKIKAISGEMLDSLVKVSEAENRINSVRKQGVIVEGKVDRRTLASGNTVNAATLGTTTDPALIEKTVVKIKEKYSAAYLAVDEGNARIQKLIAAVGAGNLVDQLIDGDKGAKGGGSTTLEKLKAALDNQFQLYKLNQDRKIKLLQEGSEDEKNSFDKRISLLNQYNTERLNLINAQEQEDIRKKKADAKRELATLEDSKAGKTAAQKARIDQNKKITESNLQADLTFIQKAAEQQRLTIYDEHEKKFDEITEKANAERLKKQKEVGEKILKQLEKENEGRKLRLAKGNEADILELNDRFIKGEINQKEYNKQREKLDTEYHIASLSNEISYTKKIIAIMALRGINVKKELAALAALEIQMSDLKKGQVAKNEEDQTANTLDNLAKIQQAYQVLSSTISGILDASATKRKNQIQEEIDLIEKRKTAELLANDKRIQSEQDKADNVVIINARAQAQREQLEQRQRQIDRQKAQADKALAIFSITLSTAKNVADAKTPWAKILAGISGAAQLAIAIATPIPKFKHGLFTDYEGPAIVDDGNTKEAIIRKGGGIEINPGPLRQRATYLQKGDRVAPDAGKLIQAIQHSAMNDMARIAGETINEHQYGQAMVSTMDKKLDQVVQAIKNKPVLNLEARQGGLEAMWKHGANTIKYTNEQTNW